MKDTVISYIVESLVCGGVFMLLYRVLVMRCGSFGFARGYLMVAAVLSLAIPLFSIPVWPGGTVYVPSIVPDAVHAGDIAVTPSAASTLTRPFLVTHMCLAVYLIVVAVMSAVVVWDVVRIGKIRRCAEKVGGYAYNVYSSAKVASPFSFMRGIYTNSALEGSRRDQVVAHEASHIRHGHQAEKGVMSLLRLLQWYNPFMWAARRYMVELHEYQADRDVLAEGYDITEYRKLILEQIMGYNPDITCGLNGSLTKKRFIMMTQKRNLKNGWLRVGSTALTAAGLMMLFGFTRMPDEYIVSRPGEPAAVQGDGPAPQQVTIIVDKDKCAEVLDELNPAVTTIVSIDVEKDGVVRKYGDKGSDGVLPYGNLVVKMVNKDIEHTVDEAAYTVDRITYHLENKSVTIHKAGEASLPDESVRSSAAAGQDEPLVIAEIMPSFGSDGIGEFRQWVYDNVKYPVEALEGDISGNVVISFIIGTDGRLEDIKVLETPSQLLSDAVVKQLKLSPKWTPGKNNGETVRVMLTMVTEFKVWETEKTHTKIIMAS